jgi:hypothetical protein
MGHVVDRPLTLFIRFRGIQLNVLAVPTQG